MTTLILILAVLLPLPQNWTATGGYYNSRTRDFNKVCESAEVVFVDNIPAAGTHQSEAYTLDVSKNGIAISCVSEEGRIRAFQTLRQLCSTRAGRIRVECCSITDWSAFRMRCWMQDVGRAYISVKELKRQIEVLSQFKINVFHWHLTENQAWRLESRLYPQLNLAENMTRYPGKYYTREEVREVVDFCHERGVEVIPEIDMPGHSAAFTRTFGLDMQSPEGKIIATQLLEEALDLFYDCPWFHIGTDEVRFTDRNFAPDMVEVVHAHGKKAVSWNPGWKYGPYGIDMNMLWKHASAPQGTLGIETSIYYLNHFDAFADVRIAYGKKIGGYDDDSQSGTIGISCPVWYDRMEENEYAMSAQNNLYPALLAVAERAWRGGGCKDFWTEFSDWEDRMLSLHNSVFPDVPFRYVRQSNVVWGISRPFDNGGDQSRAFAPEKEDPQSWKEGQARGAGIYLRHTWGRLCPSYFDDPQPNSTVYAYTYVWSPKDQEAGVMCEFQNYSRSEPDLRPEQGCWDWKGSKVWLNGEEIQPPLWRSDTVNVSNDTPLTNENCTVRPPEQVCLQKGWNKVLLKLPVGKFSSTQVRLVKWMFTFVFTTPDGSEALEGISYSLSDHRKGSAD